LFRLSLNQIAFQVKMQVIMAANGQNGRQYGRLIGVLRPKMT